MVASTTPLEKLEVAPKAKDDTDLIVPELWGHEFCLEIESRTQTYNFWPESSVIRALPDRVEEVIGVALVLVLELVKKVEEIIREGR